MLAPLKKRNTERRGKTMNRTPLPMRLTQPIRCDGGDTLTEPSLVTVPAGGSNPRTAAERGVTVTPSLVLHPRRRGPVPVLPSNRRQALPNQGASARPRPTKADRSPAAINTKAAVRTGDSATVPSSGSRCNDTRQPTTHRANKNRPDGQEITQRTKTRTT